MVLKTKPEASQLCARCGRPLWGGYTATNAGNLCNTCRGAQMAGHGRTSAGDAAIEQMRAILGRSGVRREREPGEDDE